MRDTEDDFEGNPRSARMEVLGEIRDLYAREGLGPKALANRVEIAEELLAALSDGGYLLVDGYVHKVTATSRDAETSTLTRWTVYTENTYEEDL